MHLWRYDRHRDSLYLDVEDIRIEAPFSYILTDRNALHNICIPNVAKIHPADFPLVLKRFDLAQA